MIERKPRNFDDAPDWWWDEPNTKPVTVHEPDGPEPTGLCDATDRLLYRQREPMGFRRCT